nr:acyl-CoA thioesterase domain-containing protein [Sphingopyxis sp. BSNA05]
MAFGGWISAIAGRAVEMHPDCRGPLVSQQMIFMTGVGPGEITLSVKLLRAGSTTQFWRVELLQNGSMTNAADIVTSTRRPTDIDYQVEMPTTRSPADSIALRTVNPMAPAWVVHYDQRIAKGIPFAVNDTPEGIVWIKEADGRPLDRIGLLSILDTPMPRTFSSPNNSAPVRPSPWRAISMPARKTWPRRATTSCCCGSPVRRSGTAPLTDGSRSGRKAASCSRQAPRSAFSASVSPSAQNPCFCAAPTL